MRSDGGDETWADGTKDPERPVGREEMRAINQRLLVAGVRQQEHAERAREAERRTAEVLEQLKSAHEGLHATHEHLQATNAAIQEAYEEIQASYEREHRIAQALQRPLTMEVPEDAFPGLAVATLYSAAWDEAEVGGDFYDAIPLADGRVALVVGDASGKGIAAAARAIEAKDVLRAYLHLYPFYPALTLTRLSDYLCEVQSAEDRASGTFVALSLVGISVATSEATFAWAGIEAPILVRAGGSVERLSGTGLPLGVNKGQHYKDVTVAFRPGDTLILSTDGLSEARRGREFLGDGGVDELVGRSLGEPTLRGVGTAILSGAREFAGGSLKDDACLLLARRS